MHVDVEQAHLGVGDLGERLPVDARELEEGDEREARVEHRGRRSGAPGCPRRENSSTLALRQADAGPEALDQRGLEPGLPGGVVERVRASRSTGTAPRRSRRPAGPPRRPRGSRRGCARARAGGPRCGRGRRPRGSTRDAAPSVSSGITPDVSAQRCRVAGVHARRSSAASREGRGASSSLMPGLKLTTGAVRSRSPATVQRIASDEGGT